LNALLLDDEEVKMVTGVRGGSPGRKKSPGIKAVPSKSRTQRQAEALSSMGIPFHINAANRVIVARAMVEGSGRAAPAANSETWEPGLAK